MFTLQFWNRHYIRNRWKFPESTFIVTIYGFRQQLRPFAATFQFLVFPNLLFPVQFKGRRVTIPNTGKLFPSLCIYRSTFEVVSKGDAARRFRSTKQFEQVQLSFWLGKKRCFGTKIRGKYENIFSKYTRIFSVTSCYTTNNGFDDACRWFSVRSKECKVCTKINSWGWWFNSCWFWTLTLKLVGLCINSFNVDTSDVSARYACKKWSVAIREFLNERWIYIGLFLSYTL